MARPLPELGDWPIAEAARTLRHYDELGLAAYQRDAIEAYAATRLN
ncbi:hypothetical protein [Streptomyces sp. NBC_01353]|nr:hypothetical protein [Streptomyces sp. NBC_01353]